MKGLALTRVYPLQKSSLTENWPSSCSRASSGEHSALRYIVYKQPLSLDRFFIHDVTPHESAASKLEAAFVLVNLNRFQQIVTVCTFQAQTEQIKVGGEVGRRVRGDREGIGRDGIRE